MAIYSYNGVELPSIKYYQDVYEYKYIILFKTDSKYKFIASPHEIFYRSDGKSTFNKSNFWFLDDEVDTKSYIFMDYRNKNWNYPTSSSITISDSENGYSPISRIKSFSLDQVFWTNYDLEDATNNTICFPKSNDAILIHNNDRYWYCGEKKDIDHVAYLPEFPAVAKKHCADIKIYGKSYYEKLGYTNVPDGRLIGLTLSNKKVYFTKEENILTRNESSCSEYVYCDSSEFLQWLKNNLQVDYEINKWINIFSGDRSKESISNPDLIIYTNYNIEGYIDGVYNSSVIKKGNVYSNKLWLYNYVGYFPLPDDIYEYNIISFNSNSNYVRLYSSEFPFDYCRKNKYLYANNENNIGKKIKEYYYDEDYCVLDYTYPTYEQTVKSASISFTCNGTIQWSDYQLGVYNDTVKEEYDSYIPTVLSIDGIHYSSRIGLEIIGFPRSTNGMYWYVDKISCKWAYLPKLPRIDTDKYNHALLYKQNNEYRVIFCSTLPSIASNMTHWGDTTALCIYFLHNNEWVFEKEFETELYDEDASTLVWSNSDILMADESYFINHGNIYSGDDWLYKYVGKPALPDDRLKYNLIYIDHDEYYLLSTEVPIEKIIVHDVDAHKDAFMLSYDTIGKAAKIYLLSNNTWIISQDGTITQEFIDTIKTHRESTWAWWSNYVLPVYSGTKFLDSLSHIVGINGKMYYLLEDYEEEIEEDTDGSEDGGESGGGESGGTGGESGDSGDGDSGDTGDSGNDNIDTIIIYDEKSFLYGLICGLLGKGV